MMPEMDGCTATRHILSHYASSQSDLKARNQSKLPAVIAMTASVMEEER